MSKIVEITQLELDALKSVFKAAKHLLSIPDIADSEEAKRHAKLRLRMAVDLAEVRKDAT